MREGPIPRGVTRALLGLAAALVWTIAGSAPAGAAGTWSDGFCPVGTGVTVVVDFQELGGGVHVRCVPGAVTSGFDALVKAGFEVEIIGAGFLCKLDGKPERQACALTPPASAFWSYWHASRGGAWQFSSEGGGLREPASGSVEGWSFSLDKSRTTAPPPRSATFAVPVPASPAPPTVTPAAPSPGSAAPPAQVGAATTVPVAGPGPSDSTGSSTTVPVVPDAVAPVPVEAPVSTSAPAEVQDSVAEDGNTDDSGSDDSSDDEQALSSVELADSGAGRPTSPVGTGVAVGAMALLGAGAVVVNRRRFAIAPVAPEQP